MIVNILRNFDFRILKFHIFSPSMAGSLLYIKKQVSGCYEDYKDKKRENQERLMEERIDAPEKKKDMTLRVFKN